MAAASAAAPAASGPLLSAAPSCARRRRRSAALERRLEKLEGQIANAKTALAEHDQSDYSGIGTEMTRIGALEADRDQVEERWFELTEQLG